MLTPIQASTQLMSHAGLSSEALDEAITAFNAELSQAFSVAGQVVGIPPTGISNLVRLDATGGASPLAMITATVTLAVLNADQQQVHDLAGAFTSGRFPATTFEIVTTEHMDRLRGLGQFASTYAAARQQASDRITGIADSTAPDIT